MANPPFNENSQIRGALRRVFARSPIIKDIMDEGKRYVAHYNKDGSRSKRDRVEHHCQVCNRWHPAKHVEVDHMDPVISTLDGFVDWNIFIDRLFHCGKERLQRICDWCHNAKTAKERFERIFGKEKEELSYFKSATASEMVESLKKFLKKFTPKRFEKYPYTDDFKKEIIELKRAHGLRV